MLGAVLALVLTHQLQETKPAPAPAPPVVVVSPVTQMLECIAWQESRDEPTVVNLSSGASELYQFLDSTWQEVSGLPGSAADYSAAVQTEMAYRLYDQEGWTPWYGDACVS